MSAGTPAERRLQWLVAALIDPGGLEVGDLEDVYDMSGWRSDWSPERELDFLRNGRHSPSRPLTLERVTSAGRDEATAVLSGADGKSWAVTCWVEENEPHRITRGRMVPAPPDGLEIRLATAEDGPALGELERRAPIRLGAKDEITLMTFDHGEDYFAPSRLMEEVTIYVAEVEGRIAGAYCAAVQPVLLDGEMKRLFLEHHVRIDPETRRGAVFWALCDYGRDRYARDTDSIAFYVSLENHAVRKFVEDVPPWSVPPLRALLPCPATVGSRSSDEPVPPAKPDDVAAIVDILNRCHGQSALYLPYTDESLSDRLARDSAQYGWQSLRSANGAAVGVGRDLVHVTHETGGESRRSHRALVLDHGFVPGHEADYRSLLQWWCDELGAQGATHLAVFTSERSPTYGVISELAEAIEPFDFWAFELEEPKALAAHGFYVDAVYF